MKVFVYGSVCIFVFVSWSYCIFYCNHIGGCDSTLTVGDSNPNLGKMELRPVRRIIPSES